MGLSLDKKDVPYGSDWNSRRDTQTDEERLKILLYNAILDLEEEYACHKAVLESLGMMEEEYDEIMRYRDEGL